MDSPATASAAGESPNEKPAGEPGEPVIRTSRHAGLRDSVLGTRNLMTVAALGVVGAIMVVPLTYLSLIVAVNPNGILIMCALMGAWIIPYLLPGVIVNKPGVFVVSGLVMGVIGAFLTPQGPSAILGNVIGPCSWARRWRSSSTDAGPGGSTRSPASSSGASTPPSTAPASRSPSPGVR